MFSIGAAPSVARFSPRTIIQVGLLALLIGLGLSLSAVDITLEGFRFGLALAMLGVGRGVLASILGSLKRTD